MLKRLAFFFALSPLSVFAQVQFDIVSIPICWNDSSLVKYAYVTTSGAYLDLGYFSPSGNPVTVSGGTLKTGFCFDQTFSIDSTANRTFTITLGDQTVSWVDSVGAGSGGGITALRLGELTDVDTTGEATGSIILYDATSGNWKAQANTVNNLTDGYTNGDKILQIGTDGTPVYSDSGSGDNDTTAIVIGNIADNGTVKNRVVAIGLTNNPSTGMLIDNSIVIGKNAGYLNGRDTVQSAAGGYLNVLVGDFAGFRGTRGSQITYLGQFSGQFAGGGNNTGVGFEALKGDNSAASLFTYNNTYQLYNSSDNAGLGSYAGWLNGIGGKNTYLGAYAGAGNQNGWQSLFGGHSAGRYAFASGTITAKNITNGVYLGVNSRAGDSTAVNEIVIGAGALGNGSNTATLGNNSITATYLKGTTNLRGYGVGNKEATDLTKTRSAYIAAFATDGTLLELDTTGLYASGGGITALRLGELTDVDTTGETAGSIILYDATSGNWEAQANSIDNLTDGYKFNGNIVLGRPFVRKPTSVDYANIYLGVNAGPDSLLGYANIAIGQDVFRSFIADPISQGNGNIAIGEQAMNKTLTGFQNVAIGRQAMKGNLTGSENIAIGRAAGYNNFGEPDNILTNYNQGIYIGTHATPKDTFSTNEVVIGYNTLGNGSNTATLGNNSITATYLKGTTILRGYGLGNKEATDLTKTRSGYIAAFATDGTLLELDTTGLYASGATTLNGLTDVTLTNPQVNDVLKYNGTAWVNDTLTISGGGGVLSVTANNGLTNTGTASQPVIELGGTLSKATTTISANFKNLVINRPLNFEVDSVYLARIGTQDGLSTSSKLQIGAAANSWQSVNNDDGLTNRIELYSSSPTQGAEISSYQNANNAVFTQIELLPQEMQVVTPGVNSGTATAGQVLKLVNPSTGEVEFASDSTGSATLSSLTDVSIGTPAAGEVLIYNGTAWVNDTVGVSGGGFALPTDSITFNDNTGDAVAQKLQYNSEYGTLVFGAGNDTPVHIGSDLGWYVKNQTGANIAKGVPVYASGTDGTSGRITIAPMIANNSVPAKFFLGVTAEAIDNGADGFVWSQGKIRQIDLSGFSAGAVLYVSPTAAGTFTATEPAAPNLKLPVGFVVNNTANGTLAVRSTIGNYLFEAHDVQISGASSGQALKYDGTKWVNGSDLVNDADADPTNEIQDLTLTGNTLSLSGDATTVDLSGYLDATTASNGLTEVGNDIKLGGTLSEATTITMAGNDMTFTGTSGSDMLIDLAGNTTINSTNASGYNSSLILDGTSPRLLADAKTTEPLNIIELMGGRSGVKEMTLSSQVSNDNTTYTAMYFNPTRVSLKTPNVVDLTAQNGQFLQLVDRLTGEVEFASALSAEVDGSVSNEGALSPGTGVAGSSVFIQSNTSGSSPVTISVGNGLDIAASGQTIFLNPEAFPIENGTSGAISWGGAPQRIHVLDFGANTSITLSFTNVAVGGIYTLRVTGNSGTDTLIWPASAKFEDGTSAGTVTLQDGGQMFTFYWDGTNYWVK